MGDLFVDWVDIKQKHDARNTYFDALLANPCTQPVNVGDRVVVAAGLIGFGFKWERLEATVLEKGQNSIKVELEHKHPVNKVNYVMWIHPAIITDVLGPCIVEASPHESPG